ncbi:MULTISPECIES: FAD-dependent monooxygenase [unclassified Streptomyces]|uniref:FAD-dependent monooxygenase n=1 Tax=unclassified Streptomyces TaxID=2593676 RepID=UPI00214B7698|nr:MULTISPECIES: FAD-dependent monooxygenase [unclassified Streptomyces]
MGGGAARPGGVPGRSIVAGAGIGGLAAAVALARHGWRVEVLERAAGFGEAGSGLSVWPNGVRALEALGLGERVHARALVETRAGIRDVSGRWLSRTDTEELARRHGPLVMIHRADLFDILRAALPEAALRTGTRVDAVTDHGTHVEVRHSGGVSRADLLVGADGIRSTVRRALWPQAPSPRYAGYNGVAHHRRPGPAAARGRRDLGARRTPRYGPLADGRVYLFGVANAPAGQRGPGGELAEMRRRFGGWHDPVPELLAAATEDAVMRHDIYELPPLDSFVRGRCVLLGDAAHAMTPNLGQGANQALEDAVTLAALLAVHPDADSALARYDRERRARTRMIARRSRRIGAVAQCGPTPVCLARDRLLRLTPSSAMQAALAPVLGWRPPSPE